MTKMISIRSFYLVFTLFQTHKDGLYVIYGLICYSEHSKKCFPVFVLLSFHFPSFFFAKSTTSLFIYLSFILCNMVCVSRSVVSKSLQPHGLQPARLLCLWNSPGKKYQSGLSWPFLGDLPDPGIKPGSPALQTHTLPSKLPVKPCVMWQKMANPIVCSGVEPDGLRFPEQVQFPCQ